MTFWPTHATMRSWFTRRSGRPNDGSGSTAQSTQASRAESPLRGDSFRSDHSSDAGYRDDEAREAWSQLSQRMPSDASSGASFSRLFLRRDELADFHAQLLDLHESHWAHLRPDELDVINDTAELVSTRRATVDERLQRLADRTAQEAALSAMALDSQAVELLETASLRSGQSDEMTLHAARDRRIAEIEHFIEANPRHPRLAHLEAARETLQSDSAHVDEMRSHALKTLIRIQDDADLMPEERVHQLNDLHGTFGAWLSSEDHARINLALGAMRQPHVGAVTDARTRLATRTYTHTSYDGSQRAHVPVSAMIAGSNEKPRGTILQGISEKRLDGRIERVAVFAAPEGGALPHRDEFEPLTPPERQIVFARQRPAS